MPSARRLRTLFSALITPAAAGATAPEIHSMDIPDPNSFGIERETESGRAGNNPLGSEVQGYQRFKHHPPPFDPNTQQNEAFKFYQENGYVVVSAANMG